MRTGPASPAPEGQPLELTELNIELLQRYWLGKASPAEVAEIDAWFTAKPGRREWYEQLRSGLKAGKDQELSPADTAQRTSAILEAIDATPVALRNTNCNRAIGLQVTPSSVVSDTAATEPARDGWSRRVLATVASVCALVIAVVWGRIAGPSSTPQEIPAVANATRTVVAENGQQSIVTLDDGTRVLLNAGSRLRILPDRTNERIVELDGEALFTVSHRSAVPFIVKMGSVRVTVLGTIFTVRRYPEDRRVRVVVIDGRVVMHSVYARTNPKAILGARMMAEVADSEQTVRMIPNVDVDRYTDWTRGRLVFEATPLRDILLELERRYGLVIRLADSTVADQRITAIVTDDPANVILNLIARTSGLRYTRDGNTVTFFRTHLQVPQRRESLMRSSERGYGK